MRVPANNYDIWQKSGKKKILFHEFSDKSYRWVKSAVEEWRTGMKRCAKHTTDANYEDHRNLQNQLYKILELTAKRWKIFIVNFKLGYKLGNYKKYCVKILNIDRCLPRTKISKWRPYSPLHCIKKKKTTFSFSQQKLLLALATKENKLFELWRILLFLFTLSIVG